MPLVNPATFPPVPLSESDIPGDEPDDDEPDDDEPDADKPSKRRARK